MPEYVYFIEIDWFQGRHTIGSMGDHKNINYFELKNENLKAQIEKELRFHNLNLTIRQLYEMRVKFGIDFQFFVIIFNSDTKIFESENLELSMKKHDEIKEIFSKILMNLSEIFLINRILLNFFLPEDLVKGFYETFKEKSKKINSLHKEDIDFIYSIYFSRESNGFIVEIPKSFPYDFKNELKSYIRSYYLKDFPKLISQLELMTLEFNLSDLYVCAKENLIEDICKSINNTLIEEIHWVYDWFTHVFTYMSNFLINFERIIQGYDHKILKKFEIYLRVILEDLFGISPKVFIREFDNYIFDLINSNAFTEKKDNENLAILTQLLDSFKINKYRTQALVRSYFFLKDIIMETIQKINLLKSSKQGAIKTFTRLELKKRLNEVSSEKDFRKEILIAVLWDLNYKNIQEIHGTHEYGIDILFSNINEFGLIEWNGMVVKIGNISLDIGTELNKNLKKILLQSYQAKSIEHIEKNYGDVKINRVFIVTNGKITHHGLKSLEKIDALIKGNIFYIDKNTLLNLF